MLKIILIRPGSTDFDKQGRITGTLDVPLNECGADQVAQTINELTDHQIEAIYTSPCQSCRQTASALSEQLEVKDKPLEGLKNLNHGLWHGKKVDEVKQKQPKVYRQWQERPETVCPPEGESLTSAQRRGRAVLAKLAKKHKDGVIAVVVPEPFASLFRSLLDHGELGNLWKAECQCGGWEQFEVEASSVGSKA
jgi:probable phosphoglycerate mutase